MPCVTEKGLHAQTTPLQQMKHNAYGTRVLHTLPVHPGCNSSHVLCMGTQCQWHNVCDASAPVNWTMSGGHLQLYGCLFHLACVGLLDDKLQIMP
jgi:hypothetical protein